MFRTTACCALVALALLPFVGCGRTPAAAVTTVVAQPATAPGESEPYGSRPMPLGPPPPPLPEGVPAWPHPSDAGVIWSAEVPLVLAALYSSDVAVRRSGADSLGEIAWTWALSEDGQAPENVRASLVEVLHPRLADEDESVRQEVAKALCYLGRLDLAAPTITALLASPTEQVRREMTRWVWERTTTEPEVGEEFAEAMCALAPTEVAGGEPYDISVLSYLRVRAAMPDVPQCVIDSAWIVAREGTLQMRAQMSHGWATDDAVDPRLAEVIEYLALRTEGGWRVLARAANQGEVSSATLSLAERALAESGSPETKQAALGLLITRGEPGHAAIARAFGRDEEGVVRAFQLWSRYGELRILPPDRLRALLARSDDPAVRERAEILLALMGEAVTGEALLGSIRALAEPPDNVRLGEFANQARTIGPAAVPGLRSILADGTSCQRVVAAHCIRALGDSAADAVPELAAGLGSDEAPVRAACAEALGAITPEESVAPLRQLAFTDPDTEMRLAALRGLLCAHHEDVTDATEAICELARSGEPAAVRLEALRTLEVGGFTEGARLDMLARALGDPAPEVRAAAAQALGRMRKEDVSGCSDALTALLGDDSPVPPREGWFTPATVAEAAARTLIRIDPSRADAAAVVVNSLHQGENESPTVAWRLGYLGDAGVPAMQALLTDPDPDVRAAGACALAAAGPGATAASDDLLRLLDDDYPQVRFAAASAVGHLGPTSLGAVPVLRELLRDPALPVAQAALGALRDPDHEPYPLVSEFSATLPWGVR